MDDAANRIVEHYERHALSMPIWGPNPTLIDTRQNVTELMRHDS
jgi:hypothetical protein